jgi:hypothetical protein
MILYPTVEEDGNNDSDILKETGSTDSDLITFTKG